jgi:hypothetical protein
MEVGIGIQAILMICHRNLMAVMLILVMEGMYEVSFEMGSGAMIYIQSLTKIGTGFRKLIVWGLQNRHTDTRKAK